VKFSQQSRREMMLNTARAVAGVALVGGCRSSLSSGMSSSGKSCREGFKIGICDWTLGKASDPAALQMAKELGVDGVQVDFGGVQFDSDKVDDNLMLLYRPEFQKKYLQLAKLHDIEIASFGMAALSWVPYKSDPRGIKWVEDSIEVCRAMGVKTVLIPFFGGADLAKDKNGRAVVVERLKHVAPKAEKAGVVLGLESWLSAEEHRDIIERVGSQAIKVYYDVGNSHKAGHDIYKEIRLIGEHICEFHAKDYNGPFGKGSIDFKEIRRAMDDIGYRGWIVYESVLWQPTSEIAPDLEAGFRYNIAYLRDIFPPKV